MSTCCFLGHRGIALTKELEVQLYSVIENLILYQNVATFLFGSKSAFNDLCYRIVTKAKEKYPYIKRIYVRAEFPQIDDAYKKYLLSKYEDTYYPEKAMGRAVYVERNKHIIDRSEFCVFYFNAEYSPKNRKSGTKIALSYAKRQNKQIIILPSLNAGDI